MGVMTFQEWCNYKKLVMGETPAWFADPAECERRFQAYRAAFEDSCSPANPLDAGFAIPAERPSAPVPAFVPPVVHARTSPSFPRAVWVVVFALLVQLMVIAAPARAGDDVFVNGDQLSAQDRTALESMVGPLEPGRYWIRDNGDFGREGTYNPTANLRLIIQKRIQAAQMQWQMQQQMLRQQLMSQMVQNALRQRQEMQNGYMYGNNFSSGQRYNNGSWSHYNGHSNYGVGGTADGCIYTPNWSNC